VFVDAGATILCSEECVAESKRKNVTAWPKAAAASAADYQGARLEHPQVGFRDKLVFDDGQHRVELIRVGPGHTSGDAVAYLPKEKILFTGDLCVNFAGNNVADPDANPDNWLRALDAMGPWDIVRLIPGHGAQGDASTIRGQRAYLAAMINGVRDGLAKGSSADDLVKQINLTAHNPWGQDQARNATSIRAICVKLNRP
jgi:glyoxylase-like metal-dependent hydrolase (beta-lactamase superfamily II)